MCQHILFYLFIMIVGLTVNAQTINLRGTVSNQTGKPIANAIVTLVKQGLKDTTGADGAYLIIGGTAVQLPLLMPQSRFISLSKDFVIFSLPAPSPVKVEIFDTKGTLLKREVKQNAVTGFYRFKIVENARANASKLLIIKASIGQEQVTLRYFQVHNSYYIVSQFNESSTQVEKNRFVKLAVIDDTLKTTATNYKTKVMAITNYDQQLNITLDSAGGGNAKPSSGCGKKTTLKGEQIQSVSVGGTNRQYIIRLPDDYDENTPYKLWFALHCMGMDMKYFADMKDHEFYGMWKFANPPGGKGTAIFVSPQGNNNQWANSNGADVQFIRTIIQKVESELCIDESRIFSQGFSMGGSMSYALACAMPDTIRAICMHAGGIMSGCDKTHRGPVAMFITHGTKDNMCPYPAQGVGQLKEQAQLNSCTALDVATVCKPTDESGKIPACADYQGCKTGYPCKACIFIGGHEFAPGGGASTTWADDSA